MHVAAQWAPRNLQTSILLTPYHATFAEHVGARAPHATLDGRAKRAIFDAFDAGARPPPPPRRGVRRLDVPGRPAGCRVDMSTGPPTPGARGAV